MNQLPKENTPRLANRVAIVTGAAQGIGETYARALAQEGASVVCADVLDATGVVNQIIEKGGRAVYVHTDVTSRESVEKMVGSALQAFGRIDVLVNNAAIFGNLALKPFEQIESTEWDKVMSVNVRGSFEQVRLKADTTDDRDSSLLLDAVFTARFVGVPPQPQNVNQERVAKRQQCRGRQKHAE